MPTNSLATVLTALLAVVGCILVLYLLVRWQLRKNSGPQASWDELIMDGQAGHFRRSPVDYARCDCERDKHRRSNPPCPGCLHGKETEA